jgi:prevent-host-death family protein
MEETPSAIMETVGLKALKEKLGAYVIRARDGERIVITDRGQEVAELVPLSPERRALTAAVASGRVGWSGGRPNPGPGVPNSGPPVSDAVIEDRG